MRRYLENCGRLVRIPCWNAGLIRKYSRFCQEFQKEFGRDPSDQEAADGLELSMKAFRNLKQDALLDAVGSLDVPVGDDGESTLGELQASPEELENDVVEEMNRQELKAALWGAVDTLAADQREAIRYRYRDGLSIKVVGEQLGIPAQTAANLIYKSLGELRKPDRVKRIQPYLDSWRYSSGMKGTGARTFRRSWTSATERVALRI